MRLSRSCCHFHSGTFSACQLWTSSSQRLTLTWLLKLCNVSRLPWFPYQTLFLGVILKFCLWIFIITFFLFLAWANSSLILRCPFFGTDLFIQYLHFSKAFEEIKAMILVFLQIIFTVFEIFLGGRLFGKRKLFSKELLGEETRDGHSSWIWPKNIKHTHENIML